MPWLSLRRLAGFWTPAAGLAGWLGLDGMEQAEPGREELALLTLRLARLLLPTLRGLLTQKLLLISGGGAGFAKLPSSAKAVVSGCPVQRGLGPAVRSPPGCARMAQSRAGAPEACSHRGLSTHLEWKSDWSLAGASL